MTRPAAPDTEANPPQADVAAGLPRSRYWLFWGIVFIGLAGDLISKGVVFSKLGYPDTHTDWLLDGWLRFRLYTSFNEGALWGMGQGYSWAFATLSILAFGGIVYWLFYRDGANSLWLTITLAMISAGTLGNLYDRTGLHGCEVLEQPGASHAVRDFLHFRFGTFDWAIFNVADMLLVTGSIMLVLQSFRADAPKPVAQQVPTNGSPA